MSVDNKKEISLTETSVFDCLRILSFTRSRLASAVNAELEALYYLKMIITYFLHKTLYNKSI